MTTNYLTDISDILTEVLVELHNAEILSDFPRHEDANFNFEETLKLNMLMAMHEAAVEAANRYRSHHAPFSISDESEGED
tara:strand:- start:1367 stop:1606 length:240 start_codon:yes stop_codon:yes gene_type:complete